MHRYGFLKQFSCINAVQTRAMRIYLRVGKCTPNAAVYGEMAWEQPEIRNWGYISNYFARLSSLEGHRLNKRLATWANDKSSTSGNNWFPNVNLKFVE